MRAPRKNRGPPGPKGKGGLPLKNIKLKGTGVKAQGGEVQNASPQGPL